MHVEAFHRLIKVVYLQDKQNRRIDHLLHTLLKIVRDKGFERLTKIEKGKSTQRLCEIHRRHKSAETMDADTVKERSKGKAWQVLSTSSSDSYLVTLIKQECQCQLKCCSSGACVHIYTCTCIDSTLHFTVKLCKHVHRVHIVSDSPSTHFTNDEVLAMESEQSSIEAYKSLVSDSSNVIGDGNLVGAKDSLNSSIGELQTIANSITDVDLLRDATKQVKVITALLKARAQGLSSSPITTVTQRKRKIAPNTNHERQPRLYQTKRRRTATSRWAKPSMTELTECESNLERQTTNFCAVCYRETPINNYLPEEVENISWIECIECHLWVHTNCAKDELCNRCLSL